MDLDLPFDVLYLVIVVRRVKGGGGLTPLWVYKKKKDWHVLMDSTRVLTVESSSRSIT